MLEGMGKRHDIMPTFLRATNELRPIDKWLDERGDWLMDNAKIREYLRPMIKLKGEKIKVLCDGAGKGHEMDWLGSVLEGVDVVGLDPDDYWTKKVQERVATPNQFGDNTYKYLPSEVRAENLVGVQDESMDAATMFFVLHHMDVVKHDKALRELNRVLKQGGLAFISEDVVENDQERKITEMKDRQLNVEVLPGAPHNYQSGKEWAKVFENYGFKVKEYNEIKPDKVKHGFFVLEKVKDLKKEEAKETK